MSRNTLALAQIFLVLGSLWIIAIATVRSGASDSEANFKKRKKLAEMLDSDTYSQLEALKARKLTLQDWREWIAAFEEIDKEIRRLHFSSEIGRNAEQARDFVFANYGQVV